MNYISAIFNWITNNGMFLVSIISLFVSVYIARYTIKSNLKTQIVLNELNRLIDLINYLTQKNNLYASMLQTLSLETTRELLAWKISITLSLSANLGELEKKHLNTFFIYESILPDIPYNQKKILEALLNAINKLRYFSNVENLGIDELKKIDEIFDECYRPLNQEAAYTYDCLKVLKKEYLRLKMSI